MRRPKRGGPTLPARPRSPSCPAPDLVLVHLSSEYVFDGKAGAYSEDDPVAPLSAYGASKAAGDLAVQGVERHYLLRPTWVVGEGRNFVRTMLGLAARGIEPTVVGDQIGRPTFASDLAGRSRARSRRAPFGDYHFTGGGQPASWADVARAVYGLAGARPAHDRDEHGRVLRRQAHAAPARSTACSTPARRRRRNAMPDWRERLVEYVR